MPSSAPRLEKGSHVCHLFYDSLEQLRVTAQFFHAGLKSGEHCLLIANHRSLDDLAPYLDALNVDVLAELARGAITFVDGEALVGVPDDFNSVVKSRELLGLLEPHLVQARGVRISNDVTWAIDRLPLDKLTHFEATLNLVYEDSDVQSICHYDLGRHASGNVRSALRTHTLALFGGQTLLNPHFEAPRILEYEPSLNHSDADAQLVQEMLAQLHAS